MPKRRNFDINRVKEVETGYVSFEETLGKGNAVDWESMKNQASSLACKGDPHDQIHGTRALRHGWGAFFSEMQGASGGRGVLPSV